MNRNIFIGIGAQKSATSWMFKMLQNHPEISAAGQKEVHFFSDNNVFNKGYDWYENILGDGVCGEISTSYLSSEDAPVRMFQRYPDAKILVCLRNPIDRSISHIKHLMSQNKVDGNESLEDILNKHPEIVENGLYGKYLKRYIDLFGRESLFTCFFEDVISSPDKLVRDLYNFLDVDPDHNPENIKLKYNSSNIRSSFLHRVINSMYFRLRKNKLGLFVIKMFKKIGLRSHRIFGIIDLLKKNKKVDFDRSYLLGLFIKDIELLEDLLETDLSSWKTV